MYLSHAAAPPLLLLRSGSGQYDGEMVVIKYREGILILNFKLDSKKMFLKHQSDAKERRC